MPTNWKNYIRNLLILLFYVGNSEFKGKLSTTNGHAHWAEMVEQVLYILLQRARHINNDQFDATSKLPLFFS